MVHSLIGRHGTRAQSRVEVDPRGEVGCVQTPLLSTEVPPARAITPKIRTVTNTHVQVSLSSVDLVLLLALSPQKDIKSCSNIFQLCLKGLIKSNSFLFSSFKT